MLRTESVGNILKIGRVPDGIAWIVGGLSKIQSLKITYMHKRLKAQIRKHLSLMMTSDIY